MTINRKAIADELADQSKRRKRLIEGAIANAALDPPDLRMTTEQRRYAWEALTERWGSAVGLGDRRELQVRGIVTDQLAVDVERVPASSVAEQATGIAVAVKDGSHPTNLVLQMCLLFRVCCPARGLNRSRGMCPSGPGCGRAHIPWSGPPFLPRFYPSSYPACYPAKTPLR